MARSARLRLLLLLGALAIAAPTFASEPPSEPVPNPGPFDFLFHLQNPQPCVRDSVVLIVAGFAPTPCDSFIGVSGGEGEPVVYHTLVRDSVACPLMLPHYYPIPIRLGLFAAGYHHLDILWILDRVGPSGVVRREERHVPLDFTVTLECPPVPAPLPFVDRVVIGRNPFGIPQAACPGDSIPVLVLGHFPSDCIGLARIVIVPEIAANVMIGPPRMRMIVDDVSLCVRRVCAQVPVPWSASFKIPPLPPRIPFRLPLEMAVVSCSDTFPPGQLFGTYVPFSVLDSCVVPPPPAACIVPMFDPRGLVQMCDAQIAPDRPARLTLYVKSKVALAGLQGDLALDDPGLHIAALAATGPADGMLLRWERTPGGARFVLLAKEGAPIPPTPPDGPPPAVLLVTVELGPAPPAHPVTTLAARNLLGSDLEGHGLPQCPPIEAIRLSLQGTARICLVSDGHCDWNGDGRADIRDLVLMVHCVRGDGPCPDSAAADFDCNGDHAFDIDDVFCCAREILGGGICDRCPPDSIRDARDLKLTFGPPTGGQGGFTLPLRIEGSDLLGGVRLALRFPDDRYTVLGVDVGGTASSWFNLSRANGADLGVGLIYPGGPMAQSTGIDLSLRFALKPGATPGGEITLVGGEFAAPDGVQLQVGVPRLTQPLGGAPRVAFSEPRPNPFAGETGVNLTLDRPGRVEVGVYDLSGREIQALHRGELPAGSTEFRWNGRRADGASVRDGIYFIRATAGDLAVTKKLVLLRRP